MAANERMKRRMVMSIAQFRPEKDHYLQLLALKELRDMGMRATAAPTLVVAKH